MVYISRVHLLLRTCKIAQCRIKSWLERAISVYIYTRIYAYVYINMRISPFHQKSALQNGLHIVVHSLSRSYEFVRFRKKSCLKSGCWSPLSRAVCALHKNESCHMSHVTWVMSHTAHTPICFMRHSNLRVCVTYEWVMSHTAHEPTPDFASHELASSRKIRQG